MDEDQLIDRVLLLKMACPHSFYGLSVTHWQDTGWDKMVCEAMRVEPNEQAYVMVAKLAAQYKAPRPTEFSWDDARRELRAMGVEHDQG